MAVRYSAESVAGHLRLSVVTSAAVSQQKSGRRDAGCRQRPYHAENTSSRPITEVKQHRARLVLGWVTAWEHRVSLSFSLRTYIIYLRALFVSESDRLNQLKTRLVCNIFLVSTDCLCRQCTVLKPPLLPPPLRRKIKEEY